MSDTIQIEKTTLQCVFDAAVNSLDFTSGFLDDEEVEALRAVAVLIGVDPDVGTPNNFKCKYQSGHDFGVVQPTSSDPTRQFCWRCKQWVTVEEQS